MNELIYFPSVFFFINKKNSFQEKYNESEKDREGRTKCEDNTSFILVHLLLGGGVKNTKKFVNTVEKT